MSLLDGGIAAIFGAAFGGLYLSGTLHRGLGEPIYDLEGNITGYGGGADVAVKLQVDAVTYSMRQAEGYAEGDVRIIVLSSGIPAITTDHEITARAIKYKIASVDVDPAASHYICRGRPA